MSTSVTTYRVQAGKALLGFALLGVGIAIYLLLRSRDMLGFALVDAIGLGDIADGWRHVARSWHTLPTFAVYCVPGGLWAAAYILIIDSLFYRQTAKWRLAIAAVIPAMGVISEALQALGWLPGTPDALDALCYTVPYLLYFFTIWIKSFTITKKQHLRYEN